MVAFVSGRRLEVRGFATKKETWESLQGKFTDKITFFFRLSSQRRRRVRRHPHDQGPAVPHGPGPLGAPRHLQVLLLHRRHLLPLRPAELQDEVRIVDVRPRQDRPGAL